MEWLSLVIPGKLLGISIEGTLSVTLSVTTLGSSLSMAANISGSLAVNVDFFFNLADDVDVEYLTGTCCDLWVQV